MAHPHVTALATGGDLWAIQAALWHGKPVVAAPTTSPQFEGATLAAEMHAGVLVRGAWDKAAWAAAAEAVHAQEFRRAALHVAALLRLGGGTRRAADLIEAE
ncbi:unnamed protein product, partial [Phaeothamnion confervicola]